MVIILGFSYPAFYQLRDDPLHILGFGVAHIALVLIGVGVTAPRWFDVLIPPHRREEGKIDYAPNVVMGTIDSHQADAMENGDPEAKTEVKTNESSE